MKTNTLKASLIFILALLLLDSCTLTKRRYNKGFHVDWFKDGSNRHKTKTTTLNTTHTKAQTIEQIISTNRNNTNHATTTTTTTTTTSPKYQRIKNINQIKKSHITDNRSSTNGLRTIVQNEAKTKEYKTSSQKFTPHSRKLKDRIKPQVSQQKTESNSSRGIGIFLLILGIFILIFASILLGALLVILGIVLTLGLVGYGVVDTTTIGYAGDRVKNGVNYVAKNLDEVTQ